MARSKACENAHKLTPILHKTLANLEVMPKREFANVEAFKAALTQIYSNCSSMSPSAPASVLAITSNSVNTTAVKKAPHPEEHRSVLCEQAHLIYRSELCRTQP